MRRECLQFIGRGHWRGITGVSVVVKPWFYSFHTPNSSCDCNQSFKHFLITSKKRVRVFYLSLNSGRAHKTSFN